MRKAFFLRALTLAGACLAAGVGVARADTTTIYDETWSAPSASYGDSDDTYATPSYSYTVPDTAYGSSYDVYTTPDATTPPTAVLGAGPATYSYTAPDGTTSYSYTNPDGSVTTVTTPAVTYYGW